jgi:ABC-2 type transport system permease protein
VLFTLFLGGGLGDSGSGGEGSDNRIPLLLVDEDGGAVATDLQAALAESGVVQLVETAAGAGAAALEEGEAAALLTIPAGFSSVAAGDPVTLDLQLAPNNLQAQSAAAAVRSAAAAVAAAQTIAQQAVAEAAALAPFADSEEQAAFRASAAGAATEALNALPPRSVVTQAESATTEAGSFDLGAFAAAGQLVTWVFIPLLGASGIFSYERILGTLRRLVASPTRRATFLLGTIAGQLVMGIVQMAVLILVGTWIMGINWGNSPAALALLVVSFGLAAVAMGTALGTFIKTPGQASGVSIMLGMSMALLGGCWIPMETFPPAVQQAVRVLPTTWAMQGFSDVVLRGLDVTAVLPETGVLLGFAVLFFAIGVWRFRFE